MSISSSAQALARLEPYMLLAKSAKGAAAAKLVAEVTSAPGCYVFSELLDTDGIRALAGDAQYSASFRLLQLFAYGTYEEYSSAAQGTYPTLDRVQLDKLRLLTLIKYASLQRNLSYETLIKQLGLDEHVPKDGMQTSSVPSIPSSSTQRALPPRAIRQLEDVIIDAIYAGILSARLDQSRLRVEVESVMGRDVRGTEEIQRLQNALMDWQAQTNQALTKLQRQIDETRRKDEEKVQERTAHESNVEQVLARISSSKGGSGPGPGPGANGQPVGSAAAVYERLGSDRLGSAVEMETDEDGSGLRKKKSTSGGPGRSKRTRS